MKFLLPAIALVAFLFTACQPESLVTGERVSADGGDYDYLWLADVPGDTVGIGDYVEYHAYVRNGEEVVFSTRDRGGVPARHELTTEAAREPIIQMLFQMSPGDSVAVFTPLPPGRPAPPGFEGKTEIRYDVKLEKELTKDAYDALVAAETAKQQAKLAEAKALEGDIKNQTTTILDDYKAGDLDSKLQTTASGLKYISLEEGEGVNPQVGEPVKVHYYGMLTDGTTFDNSYARGEPIDFPLGQGAVIKGWDEGIGLLKPGGKAVFFIPSDLAYGASGRPGIPANSELVFYVNLLGE